MRKAGRWAAAESTAPLLRTRTGSITPLPRGLFRWKFPADRVRDSIYSKGSIPAHGTPDMPAWGDVFYSLKSNPQRLEERVRDLTAYIESIQKPKK